MTMIRPLRSLCLLLGFTLAATAAPVPPPDKLLPSDALLVLTVTDVAQARTTSGQWTTLRLWNDPAMKPFREKLTTKFKEEIAEPLEKELGVKFADYSSLAQGQCTLALTQGETDKAPEFLLLLDARDKSETLKTKLADLKKKWVDSGKQLKTEKIRDIEITTLIVSPDELTKSLDKAFSGPGAANPPGGARPKRTGKPIELMIGQSDSLLILGSSARSIEKVLIRQSGGGVPSLSEQASFAASYNSQFRDSLAYGWINLKTILDMVMKKAAAGEEDPSAQNQMMPRPDRILSALGLSALQTLAFNLRDLPEGVSAQLQLNVPEASRKGLIKILAFEAKEASPPPFVPADAIKFTRVRLDLPKAWATLENALVEAMPQMAGVIKLLVDNAGKDKDPDFDLRKNLIANLGDDIVTYQKAPRKQTLQDLDSPPTLVLLSSPKAEQLAAAFKALGSVFPQRSSKLKEREFLGRTVYAMNFSLPGMDSRQGERTLNYAASGGYLALSYDMAVLEEYLRNSGTAPKALREATGLAEAAQKVGGMNAGFFGYENQVESMRATVEILKKESGSLANLFGGSPIASRLGVNEKDFQEWLDFSLLPPFDQIAKYFHFAVYGGGVTSEGIRFKAFSPVPPQLRK
jgi:hypothetical protein